MLVPGAHCSNHVTANTIFILFYFDSYSFTIFSNLIWLLFASAFRHGPVCKAITNAMEGISDEQDVI